MHTSDSVALKSRAHTVDVGQVGQRSSGRHKLRAGASAVVSILAAILAFSIQAGAAKEAPAPAVVANGDLPMQVTPIAGVTAAEPVVAQTVAEAPVEVASQVEPLPEAPATEEPTANAESVDAETAVAPAAEPPAPPDPCADALTWVAGAGLPLPDGVGYHCPSTQFAHHGAACFNGAPCRGTGFIAINLDLMAGTSTEYLRHVVAHEVCHIYDFQATGRTSEAAADACAAAHGAP